MHEKLPKQNNKRTQNRAKNWDTLNLKANASRLNSMCPNLIPLIRPGPELEFDLPDRRAISKMIGQLGYVIPKFFLGKVIFHLIDQI